MSYGGPVTDPFRVVAPDGQTYFDILHPPVGMSALYNQTVALIDACEARATAATDPAVKAYWEATTVRLSRAVVTFREAVIKLGRDTAVVADERAVSWIHRTEVGRPTTSKPEHMEEHIVSRPLLPRPELGGVGVADVRVLDRTRTTGFRGKQTYWEAQEFGTDAHVGRIVPGFFQPGNARPSSAEFRVHAEFQQMAYSKGMPAMRIMRPIKERGFLRHAVEDAGLYRLRRFETIKRKLIAELDKVGQGAPRTRTPGRKAR
jgi:hypothetical protein